jgi:hypothetical protein
MFEQRSPTLEAGAFDLGMRLTMAQAYASNHADGHLQTLPR